MKISRIHTVGIRLLFSLAFLAVSGWAQQTPSPVVEKAQQTAPLFSSNPTGVSALFSPQFLAQVPEAQLVAILRQVHAQLGACTGVKLIDSPGPETGRFTFNFAKGYEAEVDVVVDPSPGHLITGYLIRPPHLVQAGGNDLEGVVAQMQKLPGEVSVMVRRITSSGAQTLVSLQPDRELAIGSAFKLYILGALTRQIASGQRHWADVVPLTTRSLPSGILQKWPQGSPLTLHTLAGLMISMSDNTAADQLLQVAGQGQVEQMQAAMGHAHPELNEPFLSTLDMFELKWGIPAAERETYEKDDVTARRAYLRTIATEPPPGLLQAITAHPVPVAIDRLEWYASATDICQALDWFRGRGDSEVRGILAINPGLSLDAQRWAYIGYKGGSEPGVISLNFLLQSRQGDWYEVSAIWNNPAAPVQETQWELLVSSLIGAIPRA